MVVHREEARVRYTKALHGNKRPQPKLADVAISPSSSVNYSTFHGCYVKWVE